MRVEKFRRGHARAFRAMLKESRGEFGTAWALRMKEIFSSRYSEPHLRAFTVLQGGKPAAFFATRREVEALVLYFILIGKSFQGKGMGTQIVSRVEKMARAQKAKFIRLDAYSGKAAISFYKKLGFMVGGRVRFYEEDGDDQVFLYKKL
ncbi:MAG: GNAT family N-acetyltransferase [Candidatus Micrarchaeota archaeon]|nr:GNAT family N-acetyltransferase [Candidatus Micrarchaeota archaeon]